MKTINQNKLLGIDNKGRSLGLLKIIGGKQKIREQIYSLRPTNPQRLIEPFLGGGCPTLGLLTELGSFLCNDINSDIINFYQFIQSNGWEELWNIIETYKAEIQDVNDFRLLRDNKPADLLGQAAWLYVINRSCMNGILRWNLSGKCNSSYCGTMLGRGWASKERFREVHNRLQTIQIQFSNLDYRGFLSQIDLKDSDWIILDPPYIHRKYIPDGNLTTYNGTDFTLKDHEDLCSILLSTKAKILLTINDCAWVRENYKSLNIVENKVLYCCSQSGTKGRGSHSELIITNY